MDTCTDKDCVNWGKLVIDANVVRYVLGGTVDIAGQRGVEKLWSQRFPRVLTDFKTNLELVARCSCDGLLYTSEPVLSEELNVASLRDSAHPPDLSRSVYSTREITPLRQVMLNCVCVPTDTPVSEIRVLQGLLKDHGSDLADRDVSLLLVACKLSQGEIPVIIISDDPDFSKPWQILAELKTIPLQGIAYRTEKLVLRSYADFMTLSHECCNCASEKYSALLNAWLLPIILRHITSMSQEGRANLIKRVTKAIRIKDASIEKKPK